MHLHLYCTGIDSIPTVLNLELKFLRQYITIYYEFQLKIAQKKFFPLYQRTQ